MKEFNIDLVIDKTFRVFAETIEEAKEKAIHKAKELLGSYNSFSIDFVYFNNEEDEDCEFENEYEVYCYDTKGACVHCYSIEADHIEGARNAAREFYYSDFENRPLLRMAIVIDGEEYNYYEI